MAWLNGWQYRKKITISGSSGAGTNYQVLLKVGESSGASGYNFHINGHSANFPSGGNQSGDLRFTSDDGSTLLNFWVESVSGTSPNRVALVWVKVAADLGTDKYIYCYYGNPNATNASSVENTFIRVIDGNQPVKGSWHFDEGSGTIAYDKSGNNNNGNLYGPTWVDGKFGKALSFNGVNDYVDCGNNASLNPYGNKTISLWANVKTFGSWRRFIVAPATFENRYLIALGGANNRIGVSFYKDEVEYRRETGDFPIALNTWNHIVAVFEGTTPKLYVNGSEVSLLYDPGGFLYYGTTLWIGKRQDGSFPFNGLIDEVLIFNRALTAAEISDLYNNYGYTTTNYPGRVLVRKYVSPEPAFSFADAEEIVVGIIKHIRLSKYIKGLGLSKYFKFD